MTEQSAAPTYEQLLTQWQELARTLKRIKDQEMALRKQLFHAAFPSPKEGTNSYELVDGRIVKGKHTINRSVDQAAVLVARKAISDLKLNSVNIDDLFPVEFKLGVKAYKELPPEAKQIADTAITAKPGSPALEVV